MKKILLISIVLMGYLELYALTPFGLNGVTKATVNVSDYSDLYDKKMKKTLETLMHQYMKKLGIESHDYHNETLTILLKSQKIGSSTVLFVDLMLMGDVSRVDEKNLTFGLTYLNRDSVEIEDKDEDLIDSVTFLLEEFMDQYIQDNEE